MRHIWNRIRKDLRDYKYACVAVAVYAVVTHVFFGRFCPSALAVGFPCPACGITRATGMLLQGKFAAAFYMHAMIYPFCVLAAAFCFSRYIRGGSTAYLQKYAWLLIIAALLYYVLRMFLYFPEQEPLVVWEGSLLHKLTAHTIP